MPRHVRRPACVLADDIDGEEEKEMMKRSKGPEKTSARYKISKTMDAMRFTHTRTHARTHARTHRRKKSTAPQQASVVKISKI